LSEDKVESVTTVQEIFGSVDSSKCNLCEKTLKEGDKAFFDMVTKAIICTGCIEYFFEKFPDDDETMVIEIIVGKEEKDGTEAID